MSSFVFALVTEQATIAASHETQPHLDQANGPAAQIVCFPTSIGNAMLAKQALRDITIAVAFQPAVHRTQTEDVPMPGPDRKRGRPNGTLFECQPESMCSLQTEAEVAVERQVDGNR
ncbi:hypothetical protein ABIB82_007478 [Bradyrhizobium sp. i1.8.4]